MLMLWLLVTFVFRRCGNVVVAVAVAVVVAAAAAAAVAP